MITLALFVVAAQPHITSANSMMTMSDMSSDMDCPSEGMSTMQECCAFTVSEMFVVASSKKVTASVQAVNSLASNSTDVRSGSALYPTESPPGTNHHFSRTNSPLLL